MTLTLVTIDGRHRLDPGAAASYARARAAGMPAGITSSYRSTAEQTKLRAKWEADPVNNAFASRPGHSKHELGRALDLWWSAQLWMREHPEYGWRFTDPTEWWHAEYFDHLDLTRTTPQPTDWIDMATEAELRKVVHETVVAVLRAPEFREARTGEIATATAKAVVEYPLSGGVGTMGTATRDARIIARRLEQAWRKLVGLPDV